MNIYKINGYDSRKHYLESLADEYNVPLEVVYQAAAILGPDEDFDGLVSMIGDYEDFSDIC